MAIREAKQLHGSTLFMVFLFFFFFFFFHIQALRCLGEVDEVDILLSFRASMVDPLQYLSSWNSSSSSSFCHWHGVTCMHTTNNSVHVTEIDLSSKNISGAIRSPSIFHLPFIKTINLAHNQLYGEIPHHIIFSSSSLRHLNLSSNNFTGPLLLINNNNNNNNTSFSSLETLDLSSNMLSGSIPKEIGFFAALRRLDLGGNAFVGEIPKTLTNLTGLEFLTLSSNQLSGEIPREIHLMKSLKWIYLGYNNFSGVIPWEIGDLAYLNHLDLVYNNFSGEIPASLGNLKHLDHLFLYGNKLSGPVPISIFGLTRLVSLDLSDNSLSGTIPESIIQLQSLQVLQLFSNNFTGIIPNGLAFLPHLRVLQLWSNRFHGEIPQNLGKHNNLTVLDLSGNNLSGSIPESLCNSGKLYKLILFSNSLHGILPKGLGLCRSLQRVRLQDNSLSGELPPGFTALPLVYFLDLSGNKLSGTISEWKMPALQMLNLAGNRLIGDLPQSFGSEKIENLDLSENLFAGNIPPSFGNLSELMQMKLNGNNLSGEIPYELSSCQKLVSLNLRRNQLIGEIPASLGELPVLSELDLSENKLSGEIPKNLGKVESLVQVNISYNHFHGGLPATGAFLAINATAVAGNDLCGDDSISGLPRCKSNFRIQTTWWLFLCGSIISAVLLVTSLGLVLVRRYRNLESDLARRVEREDGTCWELRFFNSRLAKAITVEDIVSSGRGGGFGVSEKNGIRFFVKEVQDANAKSNSWWMEMAAIGKLRHRNLVNMIGICDSEKVGFLIYEFVEEGKSLREALCNVTSWERRQRFSRGVAEALRFLHSKCSPGIVVGDVSPAKVLVGRNGEALLRLEFLAARRAASSTSVAPDDLKNMTDEKGDIYGFGLILIEIITGRRSTDREFGTHKNIVEYARYCYSDCHIETWIDPPMRSHSSKDKNRMVAAMNLAIQCTATDPNARPCASDICKTLESITKSRLSFACGTISESSPV